VAAQIADVFAGVGRVDLNRVAVDRGEALAAVAETTLAARLDRKFLQKNGQGNGLKSGLMNPMRLRNPGI